MSKSEAANEAVRRSAIRSTLSSARLEGRIVPTGFVRSERVVQFLAERRHKPLMLDEIGRGIQQSTPVDRLQ